MSAGEAGLAAPAGQAASGGRPDRGSADIPFSIKPNLIYSKESFDYDFPL